jgi:predicted nucleotidyltransferase
MSEPPMFQRVGADSELPLEALRRIASDTPEISALYVFGSRTRSMAADSSDVDLGVLLDRSEDLHSVMQLAEHIEREIGLPVDLVDLSRCNPFLALEIVDGICVFRRDHSVDEFELYVLRRAGDLAHFERERRAALLATTGVET